MTTIYETERPVFNNNEKYLYVVNSIKKVPDGFEPYESKKYLMRKNIECGENVIITHKELMYLDNRTLEYLKDYTLVIDGVFNPYDTIKVYRDDIDTILVPTETISIDKDNNVTWLDSDYEGTAFRNIEVACCYGKVKLFSEELALYEFTGKLFNYFKEVIIYTVYFKNQPLKHVLDKYNVEYTIVSDTYNKPNVTIINNVKLDALGKSDKAFGEKWFKTHTAKEVANPMINIIKKLKKDEKSVTWTTFDSYYSKLSSKGYKTLYKSMNDTAKVSADVGIFMANPYIDNDEYALSTLLRFLYTTNVKEVYIPSSRMKKLLNDFLI